MNSIKVTPAPENPSQSTLLVSRKLFDKFMKPRSFKGRKLSAYMHRLLSDPDLERKLSKLKPLKWKKTYQDAGQDLISLYFYPDECDWARLSLISHATGFSRCYIFVYLMLFDLGVLKMPKNITIYIKFPEIRFSGFLCRIQLDEIKKILKTTIQT